MKISAATLSDGQIVKINDRVAKIETTPTATKYGMVKITLTGGRKVLANQDEPITVLN